MGCEAHCSFDNCFMPSSRTPVTFPLRYCLIGAPCGGASFGIVGAGSGCCEVAREVASLPFKLREGVPVLAGRGLGAFVAPGATAGDKGCCQLITGVRLGPITYCRSIRSAVTHGNVSRRIWELGES